MATRLLFLIVFLPVVVAMAMAAHTSKLVNCLPGFDGPLPFHLQTGYIEVNETTGEHLFYYFVQSERDPARDPLLLWVQGGPGCSGLYGVVYQVGPFSLDAEGYTGGLPRLLYRSQAWTKVSNIIFVDSPVGTGFSYANTEDGLQSSDYSKAAHHLFLFLQKKFRTNPFYVAGDSYGGMIIPTLTLEIHNRKESFAKHLFNLKGYIAGNPVTDLHGFDKNGRIVFLHGMGLISDELYEHAKVSCRGEYSSPRNAECASSIQAIEDCTKDINELHILEPNCEEITISRQSWNVNNTATISRVMMEMENSSPIHFECRRATYVLSKIWANDATVQGCLGIRKGTTRTWKRCNRDIPYTKDITSTTEYHFRLSEKGYRAMIYSGDHDSAISFVGTQAWIKSLNLAVTDDWRPWYVGGQVAGFTRSYASNLTYATVKGAGHTAPEDKTKECFSMFSRWISGNPL